jgi:hypothetical protein
MLIEPCVIRDAKVQTSDDKTLGTAVNVVFCTDSEGYLGDAHMLVFPDAQNPLFKEFLNAGQNILKAGIEDVTPKQLTKVANTGLDETSKIANNYVDEKTKEKLSEFFLIPLNKVAKIEPSKKVVLNIDVVKSNDCMCKNTSGLSETSMVYYHSTMTVGDKLWTDTLNLKPIQDFVTKDALGNKGKIENLLIDTDKSMVTAFTVRPRGASTTTSVSIDDFDFKTMSFKKTFAQ